MLNTTAEQQTYHDGERRLLNEVIRHLADDDRRLVYADWLEERGDFRADLVRQFVAARASMQADDFPDTTGVSEVWLDVIGFTLLKDMADHETADAVDTLLPLARPAFRLESDDQAMHEWDYETAVTDELPHGISKVRGIPDLPADMDWPAGDVCRAIYNDSPEGVEEPAAFMAQINLAELADCPAADVLPKTGLLSFWSYMDADDPDTCGTHVFYFEDVDALVRAEAPEELGEANLILPPAELNFVETLDLPDCASKYSESPWRPEIAALGDLAEKLEPVIDAVQERNFHNFLGYGRATTGDDPTPSKDSRHLLILQNAFESRFHMQLLAEHLQAVDFDQVTLNWVDFD